MSRTKCSRCSNFIKVGRYGERFGICEGWDSRAKSDGGKMKNCGSRCSLYQGKRYNRNLSKHFTYKEEWYDLS